MDRYQRVRKIGEGAFGKAVLVRHKQTNRQCVVKEINIIRMSGKEREDARKEVAVLAQLKHPNIVSYIESFEEAGTLYIVMNFCSGGDLYGRINSQHGRLFSEEQILNWFVQICLAMKHIHDRKILHRDIKSQNIFLNSSGAVQLGDFGIAKVLNNTVELARTCIGTPYYLSPEIVENKPYNNKSDIWSLGCVLYELTTLKHAFEAGNMKNLVLKIIRGSYPPVSSQYSYDLRGLIAQLFKRAPRDRPSINSILKKTFIMERVRKLMSAEQLEDEFSHTVMHGAKLAKALPPAPRPSSAPKKSVTPRPGSAGRGKYNPANVYGVPVGRKSQNSSRSSGDLKKKAGAVGGGVNRPVPVPGQQDWEQKKREFIDREQKRREENKKKCEEQVARRHQNLVEKQKMDRINKAREEGWKNLLGSSDEKNEAKSPSPRNAGDARPLPMPRQNPPQPKYPDNKAAREPGRYDHYNDYLDKLKAQRQEKERELDQRKADYMAAPSPLPNDPGAPPAVQAAQAINQANYDRQMAAQAAERAKIVEDYVQRRQAAAANKARGQADLHGRRPPSGRGRASPSPKPAVGRQPAAQGRNREEQEYLERLRQIREQNMRERRNMLQQRAGIPPGASREAEERKKKAEGLKQQAEDWARKKKEQLERERQQLLKQPPAKPQAGPNANRPGSAPPAPVMKPAPAVPITGMLQLIGAGQNAAPSAGQVEAAPAEEERPKSVQQQKTDILKRLNEKTPSRGKWGADKGAAAPAVEEEEGVQMRRPWGEGVAVPMEDPQSARSQWGEEQFRLSDLPLEQTGSAMEATSARDKVVMNPTDLEENPKSARNQWGRPGSTVVKALNQLPISVGTVSLESTGSEGSTESTTSPAASKPAIGSTITLSKAPIPTSQPSPTPTPTPSSKPPIKSGTITLKTADASAAATATTSSTTTTTTTATTSNTAAATPKAGEKDVAEASPQPSPDATDPLIGEAELPGSNRFVESNQVEVKVNSRPQRLSTVLETSYDVSQSQTDVTSPSKSENNDDEKKSKDEEDAYKPKIVAKPAVKPKPAVLLKPSVAPKPDLLPKPQLLAKPDQPYQFSEQAPEVVSSREEKAVFDKTPQAQNTTTAKEKLTADKGTSERELSVQKGLCTGNFDMKNVQMLRTCSEPDLTLLFRSAVHCVKAATIRRHQSMDLSQEVEPLQEDDLSVKSLSPREEEGEKPSGSPSLPASEEEKKEDTKEEENDADEDEEDEDVDDDDDEDLINMRATMQSLLLDDNDEEDEEEGGLSPKIKFSLSSDTEFTLKDADTEEKAQEEDGASDDEEASDEQAIQTVCEQPQVRNKSEPTLDQQQSKRDEVEEGKVGDGGDAGKDNEDVDSDDEERILYNTADILTLTDSDEETVFGDDDDGEDLDLYSRLEQQREELESELGFDKFFEVYNTVKALQEDEDENIEEGARIAIKMLGPEKQHLYPRIFQLVMADTAFTEDNA